jgi:hypothetical protein
MPHNEKAAFLFHPVTCEIMLAEFTTKIRRTHCFMNSNETAVIPLSFQQELTEKNPNLATPQTLTKSLFPLLFLLGFFS